MPYTFWTAPIRDGYMWFRRPENTHPFDAEKRVRELSKDISERRWREWQPIETAPLDGTRVLVWNGLAGAYSSEYRDGQWLLRLWDGMKADWYLVPTHWMPLPEAPE